MISVERRVRTDEATEDPPADWPTLIVDEAALRAMELNMICDAV